MKDLSDKLQLIDQRDYKIWVVMALQRFLDNPYLTLSTLAWLAIGSEDWVKPTSVDKGQISCRKTGADGSSQCA